VSEWIEVLYEQALLTEGTPIEDPQRFARRLTTLLQQAVTAAAQ
jgi:molecular chaperone HtpG